MTNHEYVVTGMTCGHCEHAVRDEVSRIPGVSAVEVSAATGLLTVTAETLDDTAVLTAVDEAGYQAARRRRQPHLPAGAAQHRSSFRSVG